MCNLYSISTNQSAIAALFRVMNRYLGNLPRRCPACFQIIPRRWCATPAASELMRWGMPPPPHTGGPPITNIRNVPSELCAGGTLTKKST